jgi:hypothetical protein
MVWEDFNTQTMFFIKLTQNVVKRAISCYNILCFVTRYIYNSKKEKEKAQYKEKLNGKKG